jgi:hypothetical protein
MKSFEDLSIFLNYTLYLWFIVRIIRKPIHYCENSTIVIFIFIDILTFVLYDLLSAIDTFNFFHIASSSLFVTALGPFKKETNKTKVIVFGVLAISSWLFNSTLPIKITYVFSIFFLISFGIEKSKSNSKNIDISIVYIILAIEQLITFIILLMREIQTDWYQSIFIHYYSFISSIIFPTITILIHVKFRRLFLT